MCSFAVKVQNGSNKINIMYEPCHVFITKYYTIQFAGCVNYTCCLIALLQLALIYWLR